MVSSYSTRFREGTNQVLTMSATGGDDKWFTPNPNLSIDSRGGGGPVWSPDGTKMAAIYEGLLAVWPVSRTGEPLGPPRRVTSEMAHSPSWAGDSKRLLYQSMDKLRIVDIETGQTTDVPLSLTYTPAVPSGRTTIHVSRLVDGVGETARGETDIVVEGNRIRSVAPHSAAAHAGDGRGRLGPDRDARADRVPLASAEGLRRGARARLARLRRHHGAQSGQHAVRGGRGSRSQRSRRSVPARGSTAPAI